MAATGDLHEHIQLAMSKFELADASVSCDPKIRFSREPALPFVPAPAPLPVPKNLAHCPFCVASFSCFLSSDNRRRSSVSFLRAASSSANRLILSTRYVFIASVASGVQTHVSRTCNVETHAAAQIGMGAGVRDPLDSHMLPTASAMCSWLCRSSIIC